MQTSNVSTYHKKMWRPYIFLLVHLIEMRSIGVKTVRLWISTDRCFCSVCHDSLPWGHIGATNSCHHCWSGQQLTTMSSPGHHSTAAAIIQFTYYGVASCSLHFVHIVSPIDPHFAKKLCSSNLFYCVTVLLQRRSLCSKIDYDHIDMVNERNLIATWYSTSLAT